MAERANGDPLASLAAPGVTVAKLITAAASAAVRTVGLYMIPVLSGRAGGGTAVSIGCRIAENAAGIGGCPDLQDE